jgi:hypothetical protein
MFDWDHMVRVVEDMWPVHKPDTDFGYHAWTGGWIIGEVLQRVTGLRFPDLIKQNLADPLQLDGLYMGLPESELPRVAEFLVPKIPRKILRGRPRSVRAIGTRASSRRDDSAGPRRRARGPSVAHLCHPLGKWGLQCTLVGAPLWGVESRGRARWCATVVILGALRSNGGPEPAHRPGDPISASIQGRLHAARLTRIAPLHRATSRRSRAPESARVRPFWIRRLRRVGRPRERARRRDRHQLLWRAGPRRPATGRGGHGVITLR